MTAASRLRALALATAAGVVVIDQGSKAWVMHHLAPGESIRVVGPILSLTRIVNTGAGFGLWPGSWPLLAGFAALLAALLVWEAGQAGTRRVAFALGLVLGGAVGNLLDRALHHGVVDFLNVHVWPVFNVADAAVTVGVLVLLVLAVTGRWDPLDRKPRRVQELRAGDASLEGRDGSPEH